MNQTLFEFFLGWICWDTCYSVLMVTEQAHSVTVCKHTVQYFTKNLTHPHTPTNTYLLTIADALLFEAQFSLQILDDRILGSLNV